MKQAFYKLLIFAGITITINCNKPTDYKKYLEGGEIVYPGTVRNLAYSPGYNRVQLKWNPSSDQSVSRYVVYWNNKLDSVTVAATTTQPEDIEKVFISGLNESEQYSFTVYSLDADGNRSVPVVLNNVRPLGVQYQRSLINRRLATEPYLLFGMDSIRVYFQPADDTTLVYSKLWYYKNDNSVDSALLISDSITLKSFRSESKIAIQSYYSEADGIDTLGTLIVDSLLPPIPSFVEVEEGVEN